MEQLIIAKRLTTLRKEAGFSQETIASLLSVSRQAISKWESGKALPSLDALCVLAGLYRTSVDFIVLGSDVIDSDSTASFSTESFSERLKLCRQQSGISQGDLADSLSVSRQSVSKWESGKAEPDLEHLVMLTSLIQTPLSLLLPAKESSEARPEPKKQAAPKAEKTEKAVKETPPKEEAPQATAKKPTPAPAPAPKPQPAPNTQMPSKPQEAKPTPDAVSRRQKLQERVRLAGQKERAAKAALLQKKIKR